MKIYTLSISDFENFTNDVQVFHSLEEAQKPMYDEFNDLIEEFEVDEDECCSRGETYCSMQFDGVWIEWDIREFEV